MLKWYNKIDKFELQIKDNPRIILLEVTGSGSYRYRMDWLNCDGK